MQILLNHFLFLYSSFFMLFQVPMDDIAQHASKQTRTISFSGHDWEVRNTHNTRRGPGPNVFSDSDESVWVDDNGRLHLKIRKIDDVWHCAEVTLKKSLGYGTYTFHVNSDLTTLDKNVVAGFFTYLNDQEEIDIEFSKWSEENNNNAQFVVQPYEKEGNIERFQLGENLGTTAHSFTWHKKQILYQSVAIENSNSQTIHSWTYTGKDIPKNKKEKLKINLWLFKGQEPSNLQEQEIVIDSVSYMKK